MNPRSIYSSRLSPLTRLPVGRINKRHKESTKRQAQTHGSAFSPVQAKADICQIIDELVYETESALAIAIKFTVLTPTLGALEFSVRSGVRGINILLRRASQITANLMRTQQHQIEASLSKQLGKPVNFDVAAHLI
ncbi:hypothetical protein [Vibrio chagasii]|uniref:Uncharacterized protein n=1 Tax=Vibrio chagasii TaxID=170679 RepID=A0A7Y4DTU7_9VIBR|nr:hypothetical protein [Vibrio chagasii]NOH35993.1 hypothetical protein [Vibrio chagasii]